MRNNQITTKQEQSQLKANLLQQPSQKLQNQENELHSFIYSLERVIKYQLYLLDSIHRLNDYNNIMNDMWKFQINGLTSYQRFQLYQNLKNLKRSLKILSQCQNGFLKKLWNLNNKFLYVYKEFEKLSENISQDFQNCQSTFRMEILINDMEYLKKDKITQIRINILIKSFNQCQNSQFLKEIVEILLKLSNFDQFSDQRKIQCRACNFQSQTQYKAYFQHLFDKHITKVAAFFDSKRSRCFDSKCWAKRNKSKYQLNENNNYDFRTHILQTHSNFYNLERPIRYLMLNQEPDYFTRDNKNLNRELNNSLQFVLSSISPEVYNSLMNSANAITHLIGERKYRYYKFLLLQLLGSSNYEYQLTQNITEFDEICIFLKMALLKINEKNKNVPFAVQKLIKNQVESEKIFTLEWQEQLLTLFSEGNILNQLYNKLLLGYFNIAQTQNEFSTFISDLNCFLGELSFLDYAQNDKITNNKTSCVFGGILCNVRFQTIEQEFFHYFNCHTGISFCLSSPNCCVEIRNLDLNEIITHCYDLHKSDIFTLISNYLKAQKLMYQFKAVCSNCFEKLNSLQEVFWVDKSQIQNVSGYFKFHLPKLFWKEIIKTYDRAHQIDVNHLPTLKQQFIIFTENNFKSKYQIMNNEGKCASCKKCKQNKIDQFCHLNSTFFEEHANTTRPLAKVKAKILRTATKVFKMTYPELQGNIFAYSQRPLILIKNTPIVLEMSFSSELSQKFKLVCLDEEERVFLINSCINNRFLSNHTYQTVNLTKQLILQQEQILLINKTLWKRNLEKSNKSKAEDLLQLEFAKLQDTLLFDDIIHRSQIYYIYQNFENAQNIFLINFSEDVKEILYSQEEFYLGEEFRNSFVNQLAQFTQLSLENQQFYKQVIWLSLFCEQVDQQLFMSKLKTDNNKLLAQIVGVQDKNPFYIQIRRKTLLQVRNLIDYQIHPLYIGMYFQIKYKQIFDSQEEVLTFFKDQNIMNLVTTIFQVLMIQSILICLPNKGDNKNDSEQFFKHKKLQLYQNKNKLFQYQFLSILNDQQFIDMSVRFKLIKQAFSKVFKGELLEEKVPGDLRWTMQLSQLILSCLNQQLQDLKDEKMFGSITKSLIFLQQLEKEVNQYFSLNKPLHENDFLNDDYKQLLLKSLEGKNFQSQDKIQNFEVANNIYIVYFYPTEKKCQNPIKFNNTLHALLYQSPKFQLNQYFNITSFQKEIEYALFPDLYPQFLGGLNTKAPNSKNFQIIVDIVESQKQDALHYLKNLKSIKQQLDLNDTNQSHQQFDLKSNQIDFQVQLIDFTTRHQFGKPERIPGKAIFNFCDEQIINEHQSTSYIYKMQKQTLLLYEQERQLQIMNKQEFQLPEISQISISVKDGYLEESIIENKIIKNIEKYKAKYLITWDNEQKQFCNQLQNKVINLKMQNQDQRKIDTFILEQERHFLNEKIKQFADAHQLNKILDELRAISSISVKSSSMSLEEVDMEEQENSIASSKEKLVQQIHLGTTKACQQGMQTSQNLITIFQSNCTTLTKEQKKLLRSELEQYLLFNRKSIDLSKDTKFRLKCCYLPKFQKHVSWIFWRYFEWMKSQFLGYQLIVNQSKGIQLSTTSEDKFISLPPIKGTDTYFRESYHQLCAYSFQEGIPLLFLTITLNEFCEKTFKVMRGINYFDLNNEILWTKACKQKLRDEEIIQLANDFVTYMLYLKECYKRVLQNTFSNSQKNPYKIYQSYEYGLYGNSKAVVIRIEFQERGSIHFHIFVFINTEQNDGIYERKYLQFLQGIFSQYNYSQNPADKEFVKKFNLIHNCSENKCLNHETKMCREGYPQKQTTGFVINLHPIEVKQRRITVEESNIITFDRLTVKFFNSNCQIAVVFSEEYLAYLTKYTTKLTPKLTQRIEEEFVDGITKEQDQIQVEDSKQMLIQVQDYFNNKKTPLQEAYLAFQETQMIEKTFTVIKIRQNPMIFQLSHDDISFEDLSTEEINERFKTNNISNSWFKYLMRPEEFEHLNLVEYQQHTINYGKKEKYVKKLHEQNKKLPLNLETLIYFMDFNSNIVKLKEKEGKQIILQTNHLHPSPNSKSKSHQVYYLQMLQLYWVHRKDSWIQLTKDSFDFYQQAFEYLMDNFQYPLINFIPNSKEEIANYIKIKFAKHQGNSFRKYVMEYHNIKPFQQRILNNLFMFAFRLSKTEEEKKQKKIRSEQIRADYIYDLYKISETLINQEVEYNRIPFLKEIIYMFNPRLEKEDLMIAQVNELLESLVSDVKLYWSVMNSNTKNIIITLAQIYDHYGNDSLLKLCPIIINRPERRMSQQQKQQQKNSSEIQQVGIIEEHFIELSGHYRNILNSKELDEMKCQKEFDIRNHQYSEKLFSIWNKLNLQQRLAIQLILLSLHHSLNSPFENFYSVFLHGPGGVGKSFILIFLISLAEDLQIQMKILCPTQQAVQNIQIICRNEGIQQDPQAQTLHSFLKFQNKEYITQRWIQFQEFLLVQGIKSWKNTQDIYEHFIHFRFKHFSELVRILRELNLLVFEEVSMIDPLFFNLIDIYSQIARLSSQPFGGIPFLILGDTFQLQAVQEKRKGNYFNSHIFKSQQYIKYYLELTQSMRQREDLDYFLNILQPIRLGRLHFDMEHFQRQIKQLKSRVLPNSNQQLGNIISPLKVELENKILNKEQVISLFLTNENANLENARKAKQFITKCNEEKKLMAKWRKYIIQPIQFSFENIEKNQDKILLLLCEEYSIPQCQLEELVSYYGHFLLLPLGIRNYLSKQCSKTAYNYATRFLKEFKKSTYIEELILFEGEEVVIKQNVKKSQGIINGQSAKVKEVLFDLDFQSISNLASIKEREKQYIINNNVYRQFTKIQQTPNFPFTKDQIEEMYELMKEHNLNNINYLMEQDIKQSEKHLIYEKKFIDPRLRRIKLEIEHVQGQEQYLQINQTNFITKFCIPKQWIIEPIKRVKEQIELGIEAFNIVNKKHHFRQKDEMLTLLKKYEILEVFFVDICSEHFSLPMLQRALQNVALMINKINDEIYVSLHQFPINLGYARTIHTAQGSTYQNAVIDLQIPNQNEAIQQGLLYTALSRVTKFKGLYFTGKFDEELFKVRIQKEITHFYETNFFEADKYLKNLDISTLLEFGFDKLMMNQQKMEELIDSINKELVFKNKKQQDNDKEEVSKDSKQQKEDL